MPRSRIIYRLRSRPDKVSIEYGTASDVKRRAEELIGFGNMSVDRKRIALVREKPIFLKVGEYLLTLK